MRHAIALATIVSLLALSAATASAAEIKVGIVDVEFVILKSSKGQAAKKKLKKIFDKKQKSLDDMQKELLEKKKTIENPSAMTTPEARKKLLTEYQQGLMKLQEAFLKNQQDLAKKELELMKPLLKSLEKVLTDFAETGNYDIIMNRSQHGVLFAKPDHDITEAVLKALDKSS